MGELSKQGTGLDKAPYRHHHHCYNHHHQRHDGDNADREKKEDDRRSGSIWRDIWCLWDPRWRQLLIYIDLAATTSQHPPNALSQIGKKELAEDLNRNHNFSSSSSFRNYITTEYLGAAFPVGHFSGKSTSWLKVPHLH